MIDSYWLHFLDLSWPLSVLCKHLSKWWERPVIIVVFKVFTRPLYPPVTQPWSFLATTGFVNGFGSWKPTTAASMQVAKTVLQKVHQQCTTTEWNSLSSNSFTEWMRMDSETTFWYNNLFCSACKFAEATDLLGTAVLWWNPTYSGTSPRTGCPTCLGPWNFDRLNAFSWSTMYVSEKYFDWIGFRLSKCMHRTINVKAGIMTAQLGRTCKKVRFLTPRPGLQWHDKEPNTIITSKMEEQ